MLKYTLFFSLLILQTSTFKYNLLKNKILETKLLGLTQSGQLQHKKECDTEAPGRKMDESELIPRPFPLLP